MALRPDHGLDVFAILMGGTFRKDMRKALVKYLKEKGYLDKDRNYL